MANQHDDKATPRATPRPWKYRDFDEDCWEVYSSDQPGDGNGIAYCGKEHHAQHIIRAVNTFDEAREALRALLSDVDAWGDGRELVDPSRKVWEAACAVLRRMDADEE